MRPGSGKFRIETSASPEQWYPKYAVKRPTIAILDDPVKVKAELGDLDDLEVVWVGQSVDALMDVLPTMQPQVLVLQRKQPLEQEPRPVQVPCQ